MKKYFIITLSSLVILLTSLAVKAQTAVKEASVKVTGEVTTALDLKLADLQQFPQTEVM